MDKAYLIGRLTRFFHQRKRALKVLMKNSGNTMHQHRINDLVRLEQKFDLIGGWNYWRHCLEVNNQRETLMSLLPSEKGAHRNVRIDMLLLMDECRRVVQESKTGIQLTLGYQGSPKVLGNNTSTFF